MGRDLRQRDAVGRAENPLCPARLGGRLLRRYRQTRAWVGPREDPGLAQGAGGDRARDASRQERLHLRWSGRHAVRAARRSWLRGVRFGASGRRSGRKIALPWLFGSEPDWGASRPPGLRHLRAAATLAAAATPPGRAYRGSTGARMVSKPGPVGDGPAPWNRSAERPGAWLHRGSPA